MVQKADSIWFDGKLVPWNEAQVHVLTHTLHYGMGVFEGIRCYACTGGGSAVFRLKEHVRRLFDSAKINEMVIPFTEAQICDAIIETLAANRLAEGYIRPLCIIGTGVMGVYPGDNPVQTIIATWPWGAYLGADALEKGIRVKTSTFTRHHVNVMMTKAKTCGNYVNSILAKREAIAEGYNEALMLDTEGYVCEATGENIFIVRDGVLRTPPQGAILAGITRDAVICLAQDLGFPVVEERFTRDALYSADEAFFTGTAAEITPIREVDRRVIGAGKRGPVTEALQQAYFKVIRGENPKYGAWLTRYSV